MVAQNKRISYHFQTKMHIKLMVYGLGAPC